MIITFKDDEERIIEKIKAVLADELQYASSPITSVPNLYFTGLIIYPYQRKVLKEGTEIYLTHLEFSMLIYLAQQPGRVFTKEQIYEHLYQTESLGQNDNIIYCLVRGIRKKLEADPKHPIYIHTIRGVGYKFHPLSEG